MDLLRTHFVILLNHWVHIGEVTAPAWIYRQYQHELAREKMTPCSLAD